MATFSFLSYFFLLLISLLFVCTTEVAGSKVVDYELLKSKDIENSIAGELPAATAPALAPVWAQSWCVAKAHLGEAMLQQVLDYACGAGADCGPIHTFGICYEPNTLLAHASFAVNSYYQKKGRANGSCDFSGVAHVVTKRPKFGNCEFPTD